jgi:hypothetical protein
VVSPALVKHQSTPSGRAQPRPLQLHTACIFDDGFRDGIFDLATMQVHADFVADLEFALVLFQHGAILAKEKAALLTNSG